MPFGSKNGTSTLGPILTPPVALRCYFFGRTQGLGSNQLTLFWEPTLVVCGPGCIAGHFALSRAGGRLSEVMPNLRKEQMENWPVGKKKNPRVKADWKARLKGEGIEH